MAWFLASCGWRLSGQRGSIRLYNPDTSSLEQNVTCAWLLETLSTDLIRFNMVKFNFSLAASDKSDVTLRLYRGSTDSTTPSFTCDTAMVARSLPSFFERGPHILILLQSNKKFLESADFLLEYHTTSPSKFELTYWKSPPPIFVFPERGQCQKATKISRRWSNLLEVISFPFDKSFC